MRLTDFDYELPPELIAQAPLPERGQSRLMVLDGQQRRHEDRKFADLPELLAPGDLLVINDTRVIPARLHGTKDSGGRIEMLLERVTGQRTALALLRASRSPRVGAKLYFDGGAAVTVEGRSGKLFELRFDRELAPYLESYGQVPLPPYIDRAPRDDDLVRYQTVYADNPGAVAAPTAGLHFDTAMFAALRERGIRHGRLTLHVGLGTFAPVDAEKIHTRRLHAESVDVSAALVKQVAQTKAHGGRIVAVGTTTVRALETAAHGGSLAPFTGETRLFILPGFRFRIVDAMITNFHLPRSSLLMLVAAFAGHACVMSAYRHAVARRYRFFSYGDAMLVLPHAQAMGRSCEV